MRSMIAAGALAVGLCGSMSTSQASYYGDEPWCVMRYSGDDLHWDCHYRSGEECAAAAAASRGSCNVNPYSGQRAR